jgi:hypothetical protein
MKIYMGATVPSQSKYTGFGNMQLTGSQNLIQTIYHEYLHHSGLSHRTSFENNRWRSREGSDLKGRIDDL